MALFEFVEWLYRWLVETVEFKFNWDEHNRDKSAAKHGVPVDEIESVFTGRVSMALGIQVRPAVDEERLAIIGPSFKGRFLVVVFTLREGRIRPISTRPANRKERKKYDSILRQKT